MIKNTVEFGLIFGLWRGESSDEDAPYKSCSARVFTDESISIILSGKLNRIHETNAQKLERQILRTACKRKAVDMISERIDNY
jgi:hypothetical protein